MKMNTTFIKNGGHTDSQVNVRIHSDRQKKCRSTMEKMERPTPMKTKQTQMAAAVDDDDHDDDSVHI